MISRWMKSANAWNVFSMVIWDATPAIVRMNCKRIIIWLCPSSIISKIYTGIRRNVDNISYLCGAMFQFTDCGTCIRIRTWTFILTIWRCNGAQRCTAILSEIAGVALFRCVPISCPAKRLKRRVGQIWCYTKENIRSIRRNRPIRFGGLTITTPSANTFFRSTERWCTTYLRIIPTN